MSVKLPGILFTVQLIDHSNATVSYYSNDQSGHDGLVGLINTDEAFHRSWYGGASNIFDNHCAGVAHAVITAYGTNDAGRSMLAQQKYRFTFDNTYSNLNNNLTANNEYVLQPCQAQVMDGECINLVTGIGSNTNPAAWLTYKSANQTPYNVSNTKQIIPSHMDCSTGAYSAISAGDSS